MEENKNSIAGFEVYDSPDALAAAMTAEPQTETVTEEAPQEEPQVVSEPTEPTPVEPQAESVPAPEVQEPVSEQVPQVSQDEFTQQPSADTEEYSEQDMEEAVISYLSEKLNRDITSINDLNTQQSPLDERVEAIAKFVAETGRAPQDWFTYQSLSTSEMDDATLVKVDMALQYPNLSADEVQTLVLNKYKLDPNKYSEDEVKIGALQMKVDAANAKKQIEDQRMRYAAPEVQEQPAQQESFLNDEWISTMRQEVNDLTGLEFDLGNDRTFTFGLDDRYKQDLANKNARLDEYFDAYVQNDGNWDFDKLNSHRAILDNIDAIVASTYRQGLSDGQRGVVQNAANVSTQVPQQSSEPANPLGDQLKNILQRNSNKLTIKI
tara:strand:- start:35432 stop:36568 length:1137 start_codon:yes stop_codon:yes gene_type:complete